MRDLLERLHGIGLWIVTGADDILVERFWKRLRRGEVRAAFATFPDLVLGFWGCAVVAGGVIAAVVALVVGVG